MGLIHLSFLLTNPSLASMDDQGGYSTKKGQYLSIWGWRFYFGPLTWSVSLRSTMSSTCTILIGLSLLPIIIDSWPLLDFSGLQTCYCPFWVLLLFHYAGGRLWFFAYQSKSHELLINIHYPLCLAGICQVFRWTNLISGGEELPSTLLEMILLGSTKGNNISIP